MNKQKDDNGKLRWDLLPLDVVEKLVEIYEFGANKYEENSWRTIENGYKRCRAALFRHLTAYDKGERVDPESGKSHLAHAAWNALSMVYFAEREQDEIEEWLSAKPSNKPYGHIEFTTHFEPIQPTIESSPNPLPSSTFAFPIGAPVSLVGHPETHDFITKLDRTNKGNIYFTPNFGWCYEKDLEHYPQQKQPTP